MSLWTDNMDRYVPFGPMILQKKIYAPFGLTTWTERYIPFDLTTNMGTDRGFYPDEDVQRNIVIWQEKSWKIGIGMCMYKQLNGRYWIGLIMQIH